MKNNSKNSKNNLLILWLLIIISGLSSFSLSIALVRSKQHIMQCGYKISQLESSCATYDIKIGELDKKILKLNLSITSNSHQNWTKNATVYHINKRDVQYFALSKKLSNGKTIAHNSKK